MNNSIRPFLKNLTLLCVDDSETMLLLYEGLFEFLFKDIIFASNGIEALELFENNNIDLILTDYYMPDMNGIEMAKRIRQLNANIPIILVTSHDENKILIQALKLHVTNFLQKPFNPDELFDAISDVVKILIADFYIKEKQESELKLLKQKREYSTYQEELSFQKELKILRNDFYYRSNNKNFENNIFLIDFLYAPLDILSGDTYSVRELPNDINFFLLVDGMGKGISASMSSMLATSFVNFQIDNLKNSDVFNLRKCIQLTINYMKKLLLEDEILSISFVSIDTKNNIMNYASFSMPCILIMHKDTSITRLKSNNQPLNPYYNPLNISQYDLNNVDKILIYSDGVVENKVAIKNETYEYFLEKDFINSITRDDLKRLIRSRITKQEDDMSFIFINNLKLNQHNIETKIINANLKSIEASQKWFEQLIKNYSNNKIIINNASIAYNELIMNAYEHGSLQLCSSQKNKLIEDGNYIEYLLKKELDISLKIKIDVELIKNIEEEPYLITIISDEGNGFDTRILQNEYKGKKSFTGRGVLMSRNLTQGTFYNHKANSVIFFIKL